jgi:cytochrome c553
MMPAGLVAGLLLCLGASACGQATGAPAVSGAQLYGGCESCHGAVGEGNALVGAPKIAAMPAWYLTTQLQNFRSGLRGKHPDDLEGLRMRAMSLQMMSDTEVTAVVEYIAALPALRPAHTLTAADPAAGQPYYTVCLACHGPQGEGNEALKAPPIARLDDWYVARQLRKFQTGVRGRAENDITGLQMAAMAATVPPDAVEHVAAYVRTLAQ